jgi:hypothetical protein
MLRRTVWPRCVLAWLASTLTKVQPTNVQPVGAVGKELTWPVPGSALTTTKTLSPLFATSG